MRRISSKSLKEFVRFMIVGVLNTLIDLAVLNALMISTGHSYGLSFALFKAMSFSVAATNSYFWNKFWTFKHNLPVSGREYMKFIFFSAIGAIINVSVATFVVNVLPRPIIVNSILWANVGALSASIASKFFNFSSYKFVVFKHSQT